MAKYIDKSVLVAEIESKIEKYTKRGEESDAKRDGYGMYWGGVLSCLNEVKTLIDTLEVKEVDLERQQRNTWKPSDEQIKALHDMNLTGNISYAGQGQILIELYNDLKKL